MNDLPIISAIIPCKNHEDWVCGALDSIVKQKYAKLRFGFIDDGSIDKSWERVTSQCKDLKQHQLTRTTEPAELLSGSYSGYSILLARFSQSYGPSCARNYMIKSMLDNTDIFAFLDSDDEYEEGKIDKSVRYFLENPFCGIVYSDYTTEHVHSGVRERQFKLPYSRKLLLQGECVANMDSLFRSEIFKKIGMFDESLNSCEDLDIYVRASDDFLLCHIPENLVKIRVHNRSSTDLISKERWQENYSKVFEKLKNKQTS